jgi:hypothetical protein
MAAIAHTSNTQTPTQSQASKKGLHPLKKWRDAASCKVSRKGGMGQFETLQEWYEEAVHALAADVVEGREFCLYSVGSDNEISEFDLLASLGVLTFKTKNGIIQAHLVDVYDWTEGNPRIQNSECVFVFRFTVGSTVKLYKTRCPKGKEADLWDWSWCFTPIGDDSINPRHARDLMVGYPYTKDRTWSKSWGRGVLGNITFEGEYTNRNGQVRPANGMYLTPKDLSFEEFLRLPSRPADEEGDYWYGRYKAFEREQSAFRSREVKHQKEMEKWYAGEIAKPQKPYITPSKELPSFRSYYIRWMKKEVYFRRDFPTVHAWVMENFDQQSFFDFDEIYG